MFRAPDRFGAFRLINAVVMMPAVVVTPVVMAPMAVVTDAPRSMMGPDDRAAAIRVIIRVIVVVGVVRRPIEETPMKAMVPERDAGGRPDAAQRGRAGRGR